MNNLVFVMLIIIILIIYLYHKKVENYFKVGISRSLEGIKDRLSDYRSIQPGINILFFTEVSNGEELERSFKNKFYDYRIRKSECYRLRSDIIFRHVLKFIHREKTIIGIPKVWIRYIMISRCQMI